MNATDSAAKTATAAFHMTSIYDEDTTRVISTAAAVAEGFAFDETGFATRGDSDHLDPITAFRVRSYAVDGNRKPRTFKTLAKAQAFIRAEGWSVEGGGVSDDGVTRFDYVEVRISDLYWSSFTFGLRAILNVA